MAMAVYFLWGDDVIVFVIVRQLLLQTAIFCGPPKKIVDHNIFQFSGPRGPLHFPGPFAALLQHCADADDVWRSGSKLIKEAI